MDINGTEYILYILDKKTFGPPQHRSGGPIHRQTSCKHLLSNPQVELNGAIDK